MQLNEYKDFVEDLWISHKNEFGPEIAAFGLAGETGEVMELVKKALRDGTWDVENFKKEMGDVLYYWVKLLNYNNIDPQEVIDLNIAKLSSRKERGVLQGSGDNR